MGMPWPRLELGALIAADRANADYEQQKSRAE